MSNLSAQNKSMQTPKIKNNLEKQKRVANGYRISNSRLREKSSNIIKQKITMVKLDVDHAVLACTGQIQGSTF